MGKRRRCLALFFGAAVLFTAVGVATPQVASAATATIYFRGSVTCPEGNKFAGAWVSNSTGGSGFSSKVILPGTSGREARIGRAFANVTVPTTVSINVGCGLKSDGTSWKYVYNGLGKVKATATGTVFINVGCTTTSCTAGARGTGGSTTVNPATESTSSTLYGQEWCTYRAAAFWKQMTGSFPGWGGDAGYWDNNAPNLGWNKRSWPELDSLMVWQPGTAGSVGHVGYVADVRVSNGVTQVKIYDRNWDGRPYDGKIYDRNGAWTNIPAGAAFIRVPPRFTPYNR
jgi:surface antigen